MRMNKSFLGAAVSMAFLVPGFASASFVLDTGTPTGTGAPVVLSTSQFLAGEFSVTAGEDITSLSAYLTQGTGKSGDTFTFDIYSSSGFTNRPSSRPAPVYTVTGTYTADGWNTTSTNWVASSAGNYWVALQVASTTNTKGLDAPVESSTTTGSAPAIAFAYAGTSGQYAVSSSTPIGLEATAAAPVPVPAAFWLFGSGLAGVGVAARRRKTAGVR